ncbi:hypothetical protein [Terriglobus saanensis]|uniref:Uncharacterized protein n=1 Tax=Terriglobus saanensis (strain ATCC BAA-1853 / DSM 23119 / SP1PR4) TaxID=401053 RepID=E8UXQ2_TERSS|nr:hypothetical protein [Terriglobus saanensis]ADV81996.1 hypothetical protein AciPR4_1168 [Terriglobus saanensis SP1PR4]
MDTLVHVVGTLWIYLRREHYLTLATKAEAELAILANTASGNNLLRIQRKRKEIAADILRLQAPLTWASLRRSNATVESVPERIAPASVHERMPLPVEKEPLVEVA